MTDLSSVSPLAPQAFPQMPVLAGVRLGAVEAGIKYMGRKDLCLIRFENPAQVAGVFTQSKCPSAPVDWCKKILASGLASCVVINSGNANAFTGKKGVEAVEQTAQMAADAFGVMHEQVFLASTGVIGEPLDASKFAGTLETANEVSSADGWEDAARAIMTTDTFPKLATCSFNIGGETFHINGIAKGAGMIAPDMATMLSFLVTDCPIPNDQLQTALSKNVQPSFNSITVDSDTSTSDTVLLFSATDQPDPAALNETDYRTFETALGEVLLELALLVVRDGEGASKLVRIEVEGAQSDQSAKKISLSIANSPLVKTAVAGEDANWGRVVMAVGKAGEPADRDLLQISFGGIVVASEGERVADYDEGEVSQIMKRDEIDIGVDIGLGQGRAVVWTCDLTKEYVAINGDYRS